MLRWIFFTVNVNAIKTNIKEKLSLRSPNLINTTTKALRYQPDHISVGLTSNLGNPEVLPALPDLQMDLRRYSFSRSARRATDRAINSIKIEQKQTQNREVEEIANKQRRKNDIKRKKQTQNRKIN